MVSDDITDEDREALRREGERRWPRWHREDRHDEQQRRAFVEGARWQAERDARLLTEARVELGYYRVENHDLTRQRDEARDEAAAAEAVIEQATRADERTGYSHHKEPVMKALAAAPRAALDAHDAERDKQLVFEQRSADSARDLAAAMQAQIDAAPHGVSCRSTRRTPGTHHYGECTCWKSGTPREALDAKIHEVARKTLGDAATYVETDRGGTDYEYWAAALRARAAGEGDDRA